MLKMNYISKLKKTIQNRGIQQAGLHVFLAGANRVITLPMRIRKQYDLQTKLPKQIEKIRAELNERPEQVFQEIRRKTLVYVESNHKPDVNAGAYSYKNGGLPILYASCYAALTRHLYNDLSEISRSTRYEWIRYILSFQRDDGLFRDSVIDIPLAEEIDWWGWRHLTLHVLMALTALGGIAERPFNIIAAFRKKGYMADWLASRNWHVDPTSVSNEVQNYATLLQYARDFQKEAWCDDALQEMYNWLDNTQDTETGLWGNRFDDPVLLSNGVQTGYHLWLLYFYDRRPVQYIERIIDSCLKTQNSNGGFGVPLNSSACEDIDSIDPLVRLCHVTDYRKSDILAALHKALSCIIIHINSDGGWVFRRYEPFQYGHLAMRAEREESAMFPTWFRTLSLAYLSKVFAGSNMPAYDWQLIVGPGHQFWTTT